MGLGSIQVEALTYIRGRSIPGQFIIIDEAQNLTKHEVKTIVSRVGEGSKIVLMGDPEQIDHPYLDSISNGLTHIVERFKQRGNQRPYDAGERRTLQACPAGSRFALNSPWSLWEPFCAAMIGSSNTLYKLCLMTVDSEKLSAVCMARCKRMLLGLLQSLC